MASKPPLVAAIDFGTTYSGWSVLFQYNLENDPTKALTKWWYSGSGALSTEKTPTVVLIKADGKTLEAFGYEAENKYRDLVDDGSAEKFYYFRRFKMKLMKKIGEKITEGLELEDDMGRSLPGITVFSLAIQYLVNDVYRTVQSKVAGNIEMSAITWVITVPAIWTDSAKKFMRLAAVKAGISSDKLLIALEPECASIFCQHFPLEHRLDKSGVDMSSLPSGTKYMIIDAGGGTVDITVHEIQESMKLKEITAASGGGWGSIFVDQAFEDMIIEIIGNDIYTKFRLESTEDWLDLWRDFELKKRDFKGNVVTIKGPLSLLEMYREEHNMELSESIKSSRFSNNIKLTRDKMKCDGSLWEQLYERSITSIIDHVRKLLAKEEIEGVKTLVMVGGFSESLLLQERINKSFSDYQVVIPQSSSSAVLRGAPIFGFKPDCISERVLQYTFGIECTRDFIDGKHPASKRIAIDDSIKCDKCFDKHVAIGQVVKTGERQTSRDYFTEKYATSARLPIYFSNLRDPGYTDEDGCWLLETFHISLTDSTEDLGKKVCVSFTFSGTEIEAEVREENTGIVTKATFRLPV